MQNESGAIPILARYSILHFAFCILYSAFESYVAKCQRHLRTQHRVDDRLFKAYPNPESILQHAAAKLGVIPIGVPEYPLVTALPKELKSSLPTIEPLENELSEPVSKEQKRKPIERTKGAKK